MKILIEEYPYPANVNIKDILPGIELFGKNDSNTIKYVGYFYNHDIHDCVFILPKVLLDGDSSNEKVFGKYLPEGIIDINHLGIHDNTGGESVISNNDVNQQEGLSNDKKDFIYKFAVWIYRAIKVYRDSNPESSIVYSRPIPERDRGHLRYTNSFLDIILAIELFNRNNQDYFLFAIRNIYSGFNKINWRRTIAKNRAIIQNAAPVYLDVVNKKRRINYEEELFIIFFSIVNYIGDRYGFPKQINLNFELITGKSFERYLNGYGQIRLLQIKYKYFSDKALELLELCYAFFEKAKNLHVNVPHNEFLLVKDFNIVFEAIIDELIAEKGKIPNGLQTQDDGKIVDHLYVYQNPLFDNKEDLTYYVGDSKYYKMKNRVSENSVYKQFTYAKNIIQWNLDNFNSANKADSEEVKLERAFGVNKLRDDFTEGYHIIPNFFISARLNDNLDYSPKIKMSQTGYLNKQFENRLFDRDTLWISYFEVNFLHVLSLYARNNSIQKKQWKNEIRRIIRTRFQEFFNEKYSFYLLKPCFDMIGEVTCEDFTKKYVMEHFKALVGKIIFANENGGILLLAHDKNFETSNEELKKELSKSFNVEDFKLVKDSTV